MDEPEPGVDPARDQQGHLDHRLHRPVPGAAEGAHAQHERLRRQDAARQGRRRKGPATADGDYFGLPWPCYGTPEIKHPGSPNLYDTSQHVMDGGGNFRANFGVERDGVNLLAEDGSHSEGRRPHHDRLSRVRPRAAEEARAGGTSSPRPRRRPAEGKNWKTDLSGGIIRVAMKNHGCHPFGNAKARAVVWNFPDAVPQHREPLYSRARTWSPSTRRTTTRRRSGACRRSTRRCRRRTRTSRQEVPADPDQRPPGRVRGRRRGDALQPVARRAAAGDVRRDQPEGGQRPRHPQRRVRLGEDADRRAAQGARRW